MIQTTMPEINVNKAIGEQPNEIWLRTGQVAVGLSFLSLLGIKAFGVEVGMSTDLAPFVVLAAGIFMMMYGTKLKKERLQAEQKHELEMAEKRDD